MNDHLILRLPFASTYKTRAYEAVDGVVLRDGMHELDREPRFMIFKRDVLDRDIQIEFHTYTAKRWDWWHGGMKWITGCAITREEARKIGERLLHFAETGM